MNRISNEELKWLRRQFPEGTRVELVGMDDAQAPPPGTRGTVVGVDDIGSILMRWDTGSSLNVIWGVDVVRKVCPKCDKAYAGHPALSRADNKTEICPDCGVREALDAFTAYKEMVMEQSKKEE